jgi:predicted MarR family transcription regulator
VGQDACERYREVRDTCLVRTLTTCSTVDKDEIGYAARVLHALSGLYDQAARAATSL